MELTTVTLASTLWTVEMTGGVQCAEERSWWENDKYSHNTQGTNQRVLLWQVHLWTRTAQCHPVRAHGRGGGEFTNPCFELN
jgi:hypothetical protein